ncbi:sulfatase [Saccharobesus litoralis]|uniref:Sulfatase n=1 Tax=Saccharobesus litoralis TaxID=2172099 RepID=A0A2S0VN14_9ALTE|nr:sulfatase [Saccharobesus litoralis]AWB65607.1 sulfatase [Saccharobesus litoralis]
MLDDLRKAIIAATQQFLTRGFCLITICLALAACLSANVVAQTAVQETDKPNILWLVVEDMSPILPDYGDNTVQTPNISRLVKEGVKFTNVYSPSGVCAPSRAALAMGMYPSSFGANHMRTSSNTAETGLPKYEAVPPANAKMLSEYLRLHGYYTTNNYKTDYQFNAPKTAWHENGVYAHWRNRPSEQPFFSVFNFTTTHESGLFEPYGVREIEKRHYFADDVARIAKLPQHHSVKSTESTTPIHIAKDLEFDIPPYLPDTPLVRRDLWKMYNNLVETDRQIGAILQQLIDDDLLDKTIIFFYADHGGPLPRQKRLIYDSGLKVPLVVRYPQAKYAGSTDDKLVSFVDFPPTTLALAGAKVPEHMQGKSFVDRHYSRQYIHAAADRFDGFTDVIRAVKDKRFKYIRYYRPQQGYYLPVAYREKIPTMQELLRLKDKLTPYQAQWFREQKPNEELFDTLHDPHELHNVIDSPQYQTRLKDLRQEMDTWLLEIGDNPLLAERELIKQLWAGAAEQPITEKPTMKVQNGFISFSSATKGASLAYQVIRNHHQPASWSIYQQPLALADLAGAKLKVVAHRIGYQESATLTFVTHQALVNGSF